MLVEIKSWVHSKEVWLNVASIVSTLATLALSQLSQLGLPPGKMFWVSLSLTLAVNVANIVLRVTSKSVVGTKPEIAAAKEGDITVAVKGNA